MVYDLLFGNGRIEGGGTVKKLVMSYSNALNSALVRAKILKGVAQNSDLLPPELQRDTITPRYARVNTLAVALDVVEQELSSRNFVIRDIPDEKDNHSPEKLVWDSSETKKIVVYRDSMVPDLLLFPPGTDLHSDPLVTNGRLVLQDKASCFSALALADLMKDHPSSSALRESDRPTVIDGCAAPGNKSLHIAALLNGGPQQESPTQVVSFEIDPQRHSVLKQRLGQYHADKIVRTHLGSFLESDPFSFPNVHGILLDPTCSGSGMVQRLDFWLKELTNSRQPKSSQASRRGRGRPHRNDPSDGKKVSVDTFAELEVDGIRPDISSISPSSASPDDVARSISNLADFQFSTIDHAMEFPVVQHIVYSTCSIHQTENEDVVARILSKHGDRWKLARVLPDWHRRGLITSQLPNGDLTVRCSPREDHLLGFFVAGFVRKQSTPPLGESVRKRLRHEIGGVKIPVSDSDSTVVAQPKKKKRRRSKKS